MQAEIKTKWANALRSGKYAQGTGGLKKDNAFCCLGVLCDIINPDGWEDSTIPSQRFTYGGESSYCSLPESLKTELGFKATLRFIEMNDQQGRSFDYIADYVENL